MTTDNIVMWATQLSIVDWVYSKTQTKSTSGESYVSLEAEHLPSSVGCARNKRQYPTVLQNLKLCRWMLDCEWMDCLLAIFGTW